MMLAQTNLPYTNNNRHLALSGEWGIDFVSLVSEILDERRQVAPHTLVNAEGLASQD